VKPVIENAKLLPYCSRLKGKSEHKGRSVRGTHLPHYHISSIIRSAISVKMGNSVEIMLHY
jgi:hypothetical protein